MQTRLIKITTEDKLILQGIIYHPDQQTSRVFLQIHGMGGNFYENAFLDTMAEQLISSGYAFAAINNRGHDFFADFVVNGEKEEYKRIGNAHEKFEECLIDIKAEIDYLEKSGYSEIVLSGHSLGAVKAAYYMIRTNDPRISRLVLMSPPDMVSLAEAEDNRIEMLAEAQKLVSAGKGSDLLASKLWDSYYLSAETYLNLFTRDNAVDIFNLYDADKSSALNIIKIPTLAFLGEKDDATILPPHESLEMLKHKAPNILDFDTAIIAGASHCYFGRENEMAETIVNWLNK